MEEKEKVPLSEKIEDTLDDTIGAINDFLYGEDPNFQEDIPATRELPSGRRVVNRIQTRKNMSRRILGWIFKRKDR